MASINGWRGPYHYICAARLRGAGDCGRLRLPGLKLGLGSGLLAQLCGQRGEPFVAPPAFLRAARVDPAYPLSGPQAPRPERRPPGVLSL